jgi:hypothetical protein
MYLPTRDPRQVAGVVAAAKRVQEMQGVLSDLVREYADH